jgi:hypothetical protein
MIETAAIWMQGNRMCNALEGEAPAEPRFSQETRLGRSLALQKRPPAIAPALRAYHSVDRLTSLTLFVTKTTSCGRCPSFS